MKLINNILKYGWATFKYACFKVGDPQAKEGPTGQKANLLALLHQRIRSSCAWYYRWHSFRWSSHIHLGALLLTVFAFGLFLYANVPVLTLGNKAMPAVSISPLEVTTQSFEIDTKGFIQVSELSSSSSGNLRVQDAIITSKIYKEGLETDIKPTISIDPNKTDKINLRLDQNEFSPGNYQLKVGLVNGDENIDLTQNFAWGVLAFNTDQSVYSPGENALMSLGVLNDSGNMVCNARVKVEIMDPSGDVTALSTDDQSIKVSDTCGDYAKTDLPDYYSKYLVNEVGDYNVSISAETPNGPRAANDHFRVEEKPAYEIQRNGPTRVYPPETYRMQISVKSLSNTSSPVCESVPSSFEIISNGGATVKTSDQAKMLCWQGNFGENQEKQFEYQYKVPDKSPEYYLSGPLVIGEGASAYVESRLWQTAADGATNYICTFIGAANGIWGLASNWDCGGGVHNIPTNVTCTTSSGTCYWVQIDNGVDVAMGTTTATVSGVLIAPTVTNSSLTMSSTGGLTVENTGTPQTGFTNGAMIVGGSGTNGALNLNPSGTKTCLTTNESADTIVTSATGTIASTNSYCTWVHNTNTVITNAGTMSGQFSMSLLGGFTNTGTLNMTAATFTTSTNASTFTCGNATRSLNKVSALTANVNTTLSGDCYFLNTLTINSAKILTTGSGTHEFVRTNNAAVAISNTGTFTASAGNTIIVDGTVAGGTQGIYSSAITFVNLQIGTAADSNNMTYTMPVAACTVTGTITVGASSGTGIHTLSTTTTLNLSLAGTPFVVNTSGAYTTTTGTVNYTTGTVGANNIAPVTYYNLGIGTTSDTASVTYSLVADTTVKGTLTVSNAGSTGTDTLDAGAYTLTIAGPSITPFNLNAGKGALLTTGTVIYKSSLNGSTATLPAAPSYNNLTIGGGISPTNFSPNASLNVAGTLKLDTFGTLTGTQNVTVNGDVTGTGSTNLTGGTFEMRVPGNKAFLEASSGNLIFYNLTFSSSAGASAVTTGAGAGSITVSNLLNIGKVGDGAATTLDAGNRTWILPSAGTPLVFNASGVLTPNASTFRYAGGAGATSVTATTYNNLEVFPSAATSVHNFASGTITMNGYLSIGGNGAPVGAAVTNTNNDALNVAGNLTFCATTCSNQTSFSHGNGTLTLNGSGSSNWTDNDPIPVDAGFITINGSSKTIVASTNISASTVNVSVDNTLDITNKTLNVLDSGTPLVAGGPITTTGSTVRYAGQSSINIAPITYNHLTIDPQAVASYSVISNLITNGTLTLTSGTLTSGANDVVINGNYVQSGGTFVAPNSDRTFSIKGNINQSSGVFTHNSGTLTLNGVGLQTITSGGATYNNLISTNASTAGVSFADSATVAGTFTDTISSSKLTFNAGSTYDFANININGNATNSRIIMHSSVDQSAWNFNVSNATPTVLYVEVKDSNASGGNLVDATTGGLDDGNNTNWTLPAVATDISGVVYTDFANTVPTGGNKTVALSINGAAPSTVETDSNGAFSFANPGVHAYDVVTLFVQGESEKGTYVFKTSTISGNISGANLTINQVELGYLADDAGPMSNSILAIADNSADADLKFGVSGAAASFDNLLTMTVLSSKTYAPGGTISAGNVLVKGVLTLAGNAVTVNGNWDSSQGTLTSSGTTTFQGTNQQSINAPSGFSSITIANTSSPVVQTGAASISGTLTINASAIYDIAATNITLATLTNSGTFRLTGSETVTITSKDITHGTVEYNGSGVYSTLPFGAGYYNLLFSGSGSYSFPIGTTTATGATTLSGSTVIFGDNTSYFTTATLTVNNGIWNIVNQSSGRTKLTTTSDFVLNNGSFTNGNSSSFYVNGNFTQNNGTFSNGTGAGIWFYKSYTYVAGTYTDLGSEFFTNSSGDIYAPPSFNTIQLNKTAGQTMTLRTDFTVNGNLTYFAGTLVTNGKKIIMTGSNATYSMSGITVENLQISGNVSSATNTTVSNSLIVDSNKTLTLSAGYTMTLPSAARITLDGTITSTASSPGTLSLTDDAVTNLPITGKLGGVIKLTASTKDITIPARTYLGKVLVYNTTASARIATLGTAPGQTIQIGGDANDSGFASGLFVYANGTANMTLDASAYNPNINIVSSVNAAFTSIQYSGTGSGTESINAGNGTWSCVGSVVFTNGTFTKGGSTFILKGTLLTQAQTVTSASQQFNNLIIQNTSTNGVTFSDNATVSGTFTDITPSSKITFTSAKTFAFANININGQASATKITLTSSVGASAWLFNVAQASPSVSYVSVKDSNATGSSGAITAYGSTLVSGNTNWTLVNQMKVFGTVFTNEDRSANIGADKTVAMSVNGGTIVTAITDSNGAYSFANVVTIVGNDVVAVYISNDAGNKGSFISQAIDANTDINADLYTSDIQLTYATAGPMTNTLLAIADNVNDLDLLVSVDGSSVATFTSPFKLWVLTGKTYTPGAAISATDIKIAGTLTLAANAASVHGNWVGTGGTFTSSGTVTFDGTAVQTITPGSNFNNVTIANTTNKIQEAAATTIATLVINANAVYDLNGQNCTITTLTNNGTIRMLNSETTVTITNKDTTHGTVEYYGTGTYSLLKYGYTYYNLLISGVGSVYNMPQGMTVNGTFNIAAGTFNAYTSGGLSMTGTGTPLVVAGNITFGNSVVTFSGASPVTIPALPYYSLTLNNAATTFTPAGDLTVGSLTITAGTFDASDKTITLTGSGTALSKTGTFVRGTSTVKYTGTAATNIAAADYYNLETSASGGITPAYLWGTALSQTINVYGSYKNGNGTNAMSTSAASRNPVLNFYGSFANSPNAQFTASASAVFAMAGDFTNQGIFDANTGTVRFTGAALQTVTAGGTDINHDFVNMIVTNASLDGIVFADSVTVTGTFTDITASSHLTFNQGSTYTFANININGQSTTTRIVMRSSSNDSAWLFKVTQASPTASYVDVRDSNASSGNTITATTGSLDSTGNTNWILPTSIAISGTVYTAEDKGSNLGPNKTITLSLNGGAATTVETGDGGVFSFADVPAVANYTLTMFISGETEKGSYVSQLGTPADISGIEMFTSHIVLSYESVGPMTNTVLATADNVANSDALISVNGSNVATFTTGNIVWILSGKAYTPGAAVNAGSITVSGTFNPGSSTITLNDSGTPFIVIGIFNQATSTIFYAGSGAVNVTGTTYYILTLNRSGTTFTAAGSITIVYYLNNAVGTFDASDQTLLFNGTYSAPFFSVGTFVPSTSNVIYDQAISTSVAAATYNNLTLNHLGTTFTAVGTITVNGVLNIQAGTFNTSSRSIFLAGSGTPFVNSGTFMPSTSTISYMGTGPTTVLSATYYYLYFNQAGTVFSTVGDITATKQLNITAGIFDAGNSTVTLSGSGTVFACTGTFTANTSTVKYTGTTATTILATSYNNLETSPAGGSTPIYTFSAGTLNITGAYKNGNGTNGVSTTAVANSTILNFDGSFTNSVNATFTASATAEFSVASDFTNQGIFTDSAGSLTLDGQGFQTITAGGTDSNHDFYNLTTTNASNQGVLFADSASVLGTFNDVTASSKVTFHAGSTYTFANINIDGQSSSTPVVLRSSSDNTPWILVVTQLTPTASNVDVKDSNASGGSMIDATVGGLDSTGNQGWTFVSGPTGITISGTVYGSEDKLTNIGANKTIALSIDGAASAMVETTSGGAFSFSEVTVAANNTVLLFISGETEKGSLVTQAVNSSSNFTNLELFTNHIVLTHNTAGPMTNALLAIADNISDTDALFGVDGFNKVTFASENTILIPAAKIFSPGGDVAVGAIHIVGTLNPSSYTITLTDSGVPLINDGTINEATSTFKYTALADTMVLSRNYYNLITAPRSGSSPTYTFSSGTLNLNNYTNGDGTHGVIMTAVIGAPVINIDGSFTNNANATFVANPTAGFSIASDYYNNGVFTNSTGTITFDGQGIQNITAGGSDSNHSFYNLIVTNSSLNGVSFADSVKVDGSFTDVTPSSKLTFDTGSSYTFAVINFNGGASGTKVSLVSSSPGTKWSLNITGASPTVSFVQVSDSDASGGLQVLAFNGTNMNSGNNQNWVFAVPGVPTAVSAVAGDGQATITFSAPAATGGGAITAYTVTSTPESKTSTGTDSPIIVHGLTNGQGYTFTVHATNTAGDSAESDASGPIIPVSVPGAPSNVTVEAGNAQAIVSFTPPIDEGGPAITGYTVTSNPEGKTVSGEASPIIILGLSNGITYTFSVHATSSIGDGPESGQSNPVTPATLPDAPTITSLICGDGQITVAFDAPSDGGSPIISYTVTSTPGNMTGSGQGSPIIVSGLSNGAKYSFTVHATNSVGNSAESATSGEVTAGLPVVAAIGGGSSQTADTSPTRNTSTSSIASTSGSTTEPITSDGSFVALANSLVVMDADGTPITLTVTETVVISNQSPKFVGQTSPGAVVEIHLSSSSKIVETILADESGSWEYQAENLDWGDYTLKVSTKDKDGNVSANQEYKFSIKGVETEDDNRPIIGYAAGAIGLIALVGLGVFLFRRRFIR